MLPGSQSKRGNSIHAWPSCLLRCIRNPLVYRQTHRHACAPDTSKGGLCLLGLTGGVRGPDCGADPLLLPCARLWLSGLSSNRDCLVCEGVRHERNREEEGQWLEPLRREKRTKREPSSRDRRRLRSDTNAQAPGPC